MEIFAANRIKTKNIEFKNLKHPVPFTIIEPLTINQDTKIIVFMNGLNGDRAWMKYFNHRVFNHHFLISFDQKGQVNSQERPSMFYRTLINYNLKVLECFAKETQYKDYDIVLMGESWGAICSLLMVKKRSDLIKGFLIWNMPGKLPSRNHNVTNKELRSLSMKTLFTLLTNINTKSKIAFDDRLTTNNLLIRASKQPSQKMENNKTSISIYFSIRPAWRIIIKNKLAIPFYYVQSKDDIMFSTKRFNKIKNHKNTIFLEKGKHILVLEKNSYQLFEQLEILINNL